MPSYKTVALLLLTAVGLAPSLQAFEFDRSINLNEQLTIEHDLSNLCRLNYSLPFPEKQNLEQHLRELMEIDGVNCQKLQDFLRDRIQVITKEISDDETLAPESTALVADSFFISSRHPSPSTPLSTANSLYRVGALLHATQHSTDDTPDAPTS